MNFVTMLSGKIYDRFYAGTWLVASEAFVVFTKFSPFACFWIPCYAYMNFVYI